MNKTHKALLDEIVALHEKKAKDYAHSGDPYSNFRKAAQIAAGFTGVDAVFATLIGVKLARIQELTQPGRIANNESLDDSFIDLTNYCAIWTAYRRDERIPAPLPPTSYPADPLPRKVGKQVNPGDIPLSHKFYPKGDRTCAVCGLHEDDRITRQGRGCADPAFRHHTAEDR